MLYARLVSGSSGPHDGTPGKDTEKGELITIKLCLFLNVVFIVPSNAETTGVLSVPGGQPLRLQ